MIVQATIGALMEQIVFLLQLIDSKRKHICLPYLIRKELKQYFHAVLKTVTKALVPSTYFSAIIHLLGHTDRSVRKKVRPSFWFLLVLSGSSFKQSEIAKTGHSRSHKSSLEWGFV